VLAVAAVLPWSTVDIPGLFGGPLNSPGTLQLLATCLVFGGLAIGYDLLYGRTGMLSFGHALYFATGAYGVDILVTHAHWPLWTAAVAAVAGTAALAAALGSVALRTAGDAAPLGRVLAGLRDDERRVAVLGLSPFRFKLVAFTVSGALAALAGVVYALVAGGASAHLASTDLTLSLLVMVVLGGSGTRWGPILGGVLYAYLDQRLTSAGGLAGLRARLSRHR
jgi:ABC-type branched-subunit amino acid transport system permease subunit